MAEILVSEWLEEFEALAESEIHTYAKEQEQNHELMLALYDVLSDPYKHKGDNLVEHICRQLLEFHRSGAPQLRTFVLQYIPTLVFLHLGDKSLETIHTLLVSLYNLEITDSKGQPQVISFRVPSIAQSSVYHNSATLEPAFTSQSALKRWEECNTKLVHWGPMSPVESLNAQNRHRVAANLLFLYNQQLIRVFPPGIEHTCRSISRLVSQGFGCSGSARSSINSDGSFSQNNLPRIPMSSGFLLELLHAVYYASAKGIGGGVQALNDILQRAVYETFADVILVANAVKNLLAQSPSLSTSNIAVTVQSRPSYTHTISKSMITNASFRTKKLPDDIPIQSDNAQLVRQQSKGGGDALIGATSSQLDSITEETPQHNAADAPTSGEKSSHIRFSKLHDGMKHLHHKLPLSLSKKYKNRTSSVSEGDGSQSSIQMTDLCSTSTNCNASGDYNAGQSTICEESKVSSTMIGKVVSNGAGGISLHASVV